MPENKKSNNDNQKSIYEFTLQTANKANDAYYLAFYKY